MFTAAVLNALLTLTLYRAHHLSHSPITSTVDHLHRRYSHNMAGVASNGPTPAPNEQVPLDSIPISPDGGMTDATNGASNGDKMIGDEKIVTVFDDPTNFNVKHALQHTWTLWFTKPPSGKQDWSELLKEVISFNSVEEFWGIYVSRGPPSLEVYAHLLTFA